MADALFVKTVILKHWISEHLPFEYSWQFSYRFDYRWEFGVELLLEYFGLKKDLSIQQTFLSLIDEA